MLLRGLVVFFSLGLLFLQGCVAVQSFPTAARAGDTITLAVGSLEGANESNLTVTFTPNADSATQINLPVRSVFNIYPDKTSHANLADFISINNSAYLTAWSGHAVWLTTVVIDLPGTLPVGSGSINVELGPGVSIVNNSKRLSTVSIGLDVLPQVNAGDVPVGGEIDPASPALFEYFSDTNSSSRNGNLNRLKPMKQLLVRSQRTSSLYASGIRVSAAEFVFNVELSKAIFPGVNPDQGIMVIRDENIFDYGQSIYGNGDVNTIAAQTQMSYHKNGNRLTVNFISPTGQLVANLIRFSIVPYTFTGFDFVTAPDLISAKYYDENGDEVTGVQPLEYIEVNF